MRLDLWYTADSHCLNQVLKYKEYLFSGTFRYEKGHSFNASRFKEYLFSTTTYGKGLFARRP